MSDTEIPCMQPFEDGTHCQELRGHHLTPIARAHLIQARAELQSTRSNLCSHGIRPEQCKDHKQPETEESA